MRKLLKKVMVVLFLLVLTMSTVSAGTVQAATYKNGSKGRQVQYLQQNISFLGYSTGVADGIYGNNTKKAVVRLQEALHLDVTGSVDGELDELIKGTVADIQRYLVKKGYLKGAIDGIKGNATGKAFKKLQKDLGYEQTGIVSLEILKAILNDSSVSVDLESLYEWVVRLEDKFICIYKPPVIENDDGNSKDDTANINGITKDELDAIKARYEKHGYYVKRNYSYNTTEIVRNLQELLKAECAYSELEVNGKFDSDTYNAVKDFQTRYKLTVDGIAGNATWAKLYEVLSIRIKNMEDGGLNINAMLDYAKLHWSNYNTDEYLSYKNANTDCCNFVSQILCAGGLNETKAWHGSKEYADITDTFDYIPDFIEYMRKTYNIEYCTNNVNLIRENPNEYDRKNFSIDDIEVGDCITYDVTTDKGRDHIMFVIGVNKATKTIYYTAHTNDRFYGISDGGYISLSIVDGLLKTSDIRNNK